MNDTSHSYVSGAVLELKKSAWRRCCKWCCKWHDEYRARLQQYLLKAYFIPWYFSVNVYCMWQFLLPCGRWENRHGVSVANGKKKKQKKTKKKTKYYAELQRKPLQIVKLVLFIITCSYGRVIVGAIYRTDVCINV